MDEYVDPPSGWPGLGILEVNPTSAASAVARAMESCGPHSRVRARGYFHAREDLDSEQAQLRGEMRDSLNGFFTVGVADPALSEGLPGPRRKPEERLWRGLSHLLVGTALGDRNPLTITIEGRNDFSSEVATAWWHGAIAEWRPRLRQMGLPVHEPEVILRVVNKRQEAIPGLQCVDALLSALHRDARGHTPGAFASVVKSAQGVHVEMPRVKIRTYALGDEAAKSRPLFLGLHAQGEP